MSEVEVRAARVSDLPLIFRGERRYMLDVEPEHFLSWLDHLDRNLELWIENLPRAIVCVVDGDDGGYAMWRQDGPDVTVITIHVLHRFRGQGLGRRAMAAVIDQARQHNARRVHLDVEADNRPARGLYERMGFRLLDADGDYVAYELELGGGACLALRPHRDHPYT